MMPMNAIVSTSGHISFPWNYTPVGDITVIGLCWLMFLLLLQTYLQRDKNLMLLVGILLSTIVSATSGIIFQYSMAAPTICLGLIYSTRILHNISLVLILFLIIRYLQDPLWIRQTVQSVYQKRTYALIILSVAVDIIGTIFHFTFYVDGDGTVHNVFNIYSILYFLMTGSIFFLIIKHRSRIIRQVFWGLLGANVISVVIMLVQGLFQQVSFTGVAYFFPVLAIIFMFHSNPFDLDTGAASDTYFHQALTNAIERNQKLVILSCNVANFSKLLSESTDLRAEYHLFFRTHVRKGVLYRINDRLILTFPKEEGNQQAEHIEKMFESFENSHKKFDLDYKLIQMETTPDIAKASDYLHIVEDTENSMAFNTIYRIGEKDISKYYGSIYILSELEDIAQRKDLDDPRVNVFCQPVYNIRTDCYDTAEALMRLNLPQCGMVPPDKFIPLAEQYGYIHTLSLIILNKTCGAIRTLIEDNYSINRISVNFSTLDIRYDSFCKEVQQIIDRNLIPYEKIAIEITESRSEADFQIMKAKVEELQKLGIKFYLDDFGTGYSSFERIMEIPFDIIKFDRSMTIESAKNEDSFYMVSTFAKMFSNLHYSVLFEGIEDDRDEENCVKMCARYLQGYKYSKPIPIEELSGFLKKAS